MEADNLIPAPRTPLSHNISFKKLYSRNASQGVLLNLSISGAFMRHADGDLKPQDKVAITVSIAGRERKLQAVVIWSNSAGSGIKFLPTNKRDTQIIDDLIYFVESKRDGSRSVMNQILKNVA